MVEFSLAINLNKFPWHPAAPSALKSALVHFNFIPRVVPEEVQSMLNRDKGA